MTGNPDRERPSGPRRPDCNIVEQTIINSPRAAVLQTLKVGQDLEVVTTPNGQSILAQTAGGVAVGSLTPIALPELLDCIAQGRRYGAVVLRISGARCDVEIRPR